MPVARDTRHVTKKLSFAFHQRRNSLPQQQVRSTVESFSECLIDWRLELLMIETDKP